MVTNTTPSSCRKSELLFLLPTPLESLDIDIGLMMSEDCGKENDPVVGDGLRSRGDNALLGILRPPKQQGKGGENK